ncbi:hypothetical protein [Vreelandella nigrificans]|uniref:Uncharacterized protein n=1 Tax=Vreelandella nigrificans TaxID=2042704 RepID=A0A2A4HFA8_9GAMM|nr:hypothetical protein [Halomonas nigrificans]PCF93598.1 hypothetical protein CPA45_21530 [Halomonas nigrificans]
MNNNTPSDAKFYYTDDLSDLPLNGGIASDDLFHLSAKEESGVVFSGQNPEASLPNLAPSALGQCLFSPATEESTNYCHVKVPLLSVGTTQYRIMPMAYINATVFNTPASIPLFEPVEVTESGVLTFRYKGKYPLYTILHGGITMTVRVNESGIGRSRITLVLIAINDDHKPSWEKGQNNGNMFLGASMASLDQAPTVLATPNEYTDVEPDNPTDGSALDGQWVRKTIQVCKDVVFYPETTYAFRILSRSYGTVSHVDYGYRFESGGFSCMFDASAILKAKLAQLKDE